MIVEMPATALSDVGGQVTDGLASYSVIITLLVGVFLAFFIIERIVDMLRHKKNE